MECNSEKGSPMGEEKKRYSGKSDPIGERPTYYRLPAKPERSV
ncbi:hypothetical protein [Arenibacter latericius]|nr:hypothetical protein [Arenibacter latericius]MDX1364621.1 hypothetical protein [Arenibacter latericius]